MNLPRLPTDKISAIYCDIDVPFEKFRTSPEIFNINGVLLTLQARDKVAGIKAKIRMSSGGNTHLVVFLKEPVCTLRYIQIRAALGDDPQHLACDLNRMFRFGDDTARQNLTADKKIKQGRLVRAGAWEPL
jgi:hypothetical protein